MEANPELRVHMEGLIQTLMKLLLRGTAITTLFLERRIMNTSIRRITMRMWMTTRRTSLNLFLPLETRFLSTLRPFVTPSTPITPLFSKTEQSQLPTEGDLPRNTPLRKLKTRICIKLWSSKEGTQLSLWREITQMKWGKRRCRSSILWEIMRLLQIQVKWPKQSLFDSFKERQWVFNLNSLQRVLIQLSL